MKSCSNPLTLFDLHQDLLTMSIPAQEMNENALEVMAKLSITCKRFHALFQPPIQIIRLLLRLMKHELTQAENIIKCDANFLFQKFKITDPSGRGFHLSPLEFAYWAYDTPALKMMLKYFVTEELKLKALDMLNEFDKRGSEYGVHYDYSPLMNAYQDYLTFYENLDFDNLSYNHKMSLEKLWLDIGKAQRLTPVNIINECYTIFRFGKKDEAPIFSIPLYPLRPKRGLGFDFTLTGGAYGIVREYNFEKLAAQASHAQEGLKTLRNLIEARVFELAEIKNQLKMPLVDVANPSSNKCVIS